MRKISSVILLVVVLLFINTTKTFADLNINYDTYAQSLSELGVFVGTGNGFELDRAPTRIEGIIMLIRLLGAEDDAQLMNNSVTPFTDVPTWANGYVSYAFEKGLTKGVSDTKFGSTNSLEAKAYITFLLRSLGYSDADGEFTYNNAIDFSLQEGLIDSSMQSILTSSSFLRAHVAKLSYDTLKFPYKNKDTLLIDKLIVEEKISSNIGNDFKENIVNETNLPVTENNTITEVSKNTESIIMLLCSTQEGTSQGSGIIIDSNGEILTNYHVIEGATDVAVYFNDGSSYNEEVYVQDYDKDLDLAILKINKKSLNAIKIGDSDSLELGESIIAIGSPLGYFNTVTEGIVSAIRTDSIQISAAISHGSSGGGLFNINGELVGVTYAGVEDAENLGFAIPINLIKQISEKKLTPVFEFGENTSLATDTISPPSNIRIANETYDKIYLNWDEVPNAEYYHFYFQEDGEDTYWYDEESGSKMKFYYNDDYSAIYSGLTPGIKYNVILTSVKNDVESVDSEVFSFIKSYGDYYSIFYDEYYGVPDFGKVIGCKSYFESDKMYYYNAYNLKSSDLILYYNSLTENGFNYFSSFYTDDGNLIYTYQNYTIDKTVMIGYTNLQGTTCYFVYITDI